MVHSLPAVLGEVAKPGGVLKALYDDLASPGVKQVGKALETVLETGNILLLPLRLLNQHASEFETRSFAQIADRFQTIPESEVVDVRPEIGVPILEKLSVTHDEDLRRLFVELLASAADRRKVSLAHPSFVRVIESLSPDEALLLKAWKTNAMYPCLSVKKMARDGASRKLRDLVMVPPVPLAEESMLPAYIANLMGLGLLVRREDGWLTEDGVYDVVLQKVRKEFADIKDGALELTLKGDEKLSEGDVVYQKGYIEILPYGFVFQKACIA